MFAVTALNTIFQKWGISASSNQWNISGEPCSGAAIDSTSFDDQNHNPFIKCDYSYNSNSTCHITQFCPPSPISSPPSPISSPPSLEIFIGDSIHRSLNRREREPSPISHSNGDDSNGDASAIRTATLRRFERRRFSDSNGDASAIRTATLRLLRTATLRLPRTATLRLLELRRFAFLEPATLCRPSHRRRFEVSFQLPSSPILVVANLDPFVADSRRF
nr:isoform 3 of probable lrr receptor-like serine/threonine-protein kinase [Quercus suber]